MRRNGHYTSEINLIWMEVIKFMETCRYYTKKEINEMYREFKYDLEKADAIDTICSIEENINNCRPTITEHSKVFVFDNSSDEKEAKALIERIKRYATPFTENRRLTARAKSVKTFGDMVEFLKEELIGKEVSSYDMASKMQDVLKYIDKRLYVVKDDYESTFHIFLNVGREIYNYSYNGYYKGNNGRNCRVCYDNPKIGSVGATKECTARHSYYSNDYAFKNIRVKYGELGKTISDAEAKYTEAQEAKRLAKEAEAKKQNDIGETFIESLKAHGFDDFEALKAFLATASAEQKKELKTV